MEPLTHLVLARKISLAMSRPETGLSFVGVKRQTVPNQSLSLREIIKRFIRREPLPLSNDGVYEDRYTDLEKLSKADITVQHEYLRSVKSKIREFERGEEEKKKAAATAAKEKEKADIIATYLASQTPTPVQGGTPA